MLQTQPMSLSPDTGEKDSACRQDHGSPVDIKFWVADTGESQQRALLRVFCDSEVFDTAAENWLQSKM